MRQPVYLLTTMVVTILLASGASFLGLGLGGVSVAEAQASEETLSGTLNVRWIDPQPDSNIDPSVDFVLTDDQGKKKELQVDEEVIKRAGGVQALNGKRVTVEGNVTQSDQGKERGTTDDQVDVQRIVPEQNARDATEAQKTVSGQKPNVTILCRFSDTTTVTPHDKSWFETLMGGTNPGIDNYWREISYNNINLTGSTVVGWYNLPRAKSYYQVSGGYDEDLLAQDCTKAADAAVFFPNYTNINLMFNDNPGYYALGGTNTLSLDGGPRTYGMTWMPRFSYETSSTSGFSGTGQVWIAHEMGHSFGLPHSSGPYSETYDSDWDPMSDGSVCTPSHTEYGCVGVYTTSYHMDQLLGWIPSSRKYTATSSSDQNVTLERLGNPNSNGAYLMAQIPIPGSTTRFYTVEVRHFTGYDGQTPGEAVVINKIDTTLSDRNAKVVDADNNGDPNDAGAMWLPGETFTDSANKISVKVTGSTTSGYTLTINPSSTVDTTTPVAEAPADNFVENSTLGSTVPVKLNWSATDADGIYRYQLQQSINDGAWANVSLPTYTTTSKTLNLKPNSTYKFQVRAQDKKGNWSAWAQGRSFKVGRFQENSSTGVSYPIGTWTRTYLYGASGNYVQRAKAPGDTARFTFTGSDVSWVATKSKTQGKAEVYVDGVYQKTVDLYSSTTYKRKVVFQKEGLDPSKSHTLEVKVLGTAGRPTVDVDAFVVLQ